MNSGDPADRCGTTWRDRQVEGFVIVSNRIIDDGSANKEILCTITQISIEVS